MQITPRESVIMPVAISPMYLKNSRITDVVGEHLKFSDGKCNISYPQKIASHLLTPDNVHYMCTADKFIPISTNMPVFEFKNDKLISKNMKQQTSRNCSMPLASPCQFPPPSPLGYTNIQNEKKETFTGSITSENHNYEKQDIIKNNGRSETRKNVQNLRLGSAFFTGTIERILRWNRNLQDIFCLFETIAPIISIQEGRISHQKIMLLRDRKGPILQVQYFATTHIDINDFYIGQYLRCVGRMIGMNILSAESIREAKEEEVLNLSRLSYVCDYSVNQNMNKE